jgi:hypothetical protein
MLTRVVRIAVQEDGSWFVGCGFIGEVSVQELQAFRQEWLRAPQKDRRAWVQGFPKIWAVCQADASAAPKPFTAEVRDLSPGGISLVAPHKLEAGTRVKIMLPAVEGNPPRTVQVQAVRHDRLPSGRWLVGCVLFEDPPRVDQPPPVAAADRRVGATAGERPGNSGRPKKHPRKLLTQSLAVAASHPAETVAETAEHMAHVEAQVYRAFRQLAEQFLAEWRCQVRPPSSGE